MLLISRLIISVILVVTSLNVSANSYDEIWKLLLKNKREEALTQLQKIKKSNNAIEGLLLENLIKSQLGQFESP